MNDNRVFHPDFPSDHPLIGSLQWIYDATRLHSDSAADASGMQRLRTGSSFSGCTTSRGITTVDSPSSRTIYTCGSIEDLIPSTRMAAASRIIRCRSDPRRSAHAFLLPSRCEKSSTPPCERIVDDCG